ncbi:MAG: hypothetical protein D6830_07725 [Ignavibacteria bacterium]|nr:MAG: hypothetical protein D6830_07725 [Ignavibacteria bacterium]
MKNLLFVFCSLLLVFNYSHAQSNFRLTLGPTTFCFLNAENSSPKVDISIGASKDSHLYDKFSLSAGLGFASRGAIFENRTCAPYPSESVNAYSPDRHGRSGYTQTSTTTQDENSSPKQIKKSKLLWSVGTNLSSYPGEEGRWQLGYSIGLTFNYGVYKNLSMTIPLSYTRINTALENLEAAEPSPLSGDTLYRTLRDWQISAAFFEIPLLFVFEFPSKNFVLGYILGPGLAIAVKDFSKLENFNRTDEILGLDDHYDPVDPDTGELRSVINIITGVRLHINRYYLDLLYTFYPDHIKYIDKLDRESMYFPNGIKRINKLNSISVKLSIDIF